MQLIFPGHFSNLMDFSCSFLIILIYQVVSYSRLMLLGVIGWLVLIEHWMWVILCFGLRVIILSFLVLECLFRLIHSKKTMSWKKGEGIIWDYTFLKISHFWVFFLFESSFDEARIKTKTLFSPCFMRFYITMYI